MVFPGIDALYIAGLSLDERFLRVLDPDTRSDGGFTVRRESA